MKTSDSNWASGSAPSLTNTTIYLWADYNSGSDRFILDDITGSNLTDSGKAVMICPLYTDSADNLYGAKIIGEGKSVDYVFSALFAYTTTGTKTVKAPANSLLKGYTTGSVKDLNDDITYAGISITDLLQSDESSQIENVSGNTYIKGFRLER